MSQRKKNDYLLDVDVDRVHCDPEQPRKHFDHEKLVRLVETIVSDGQATRAIVRPHRTRSRHFTLIGGERRWRAVRMIPKSRRPLLKVIVVDEPDDDRAFELAFIDNENRTSLYPLETAYAMKRLRDKGHSVADLARMVGRTSAHIYNCLSLCDLDARVQAMMDPAIPEKKRLRYSQAVTVARLPKRLQQKLARVAVENRSTSSHLRDIVDGELTRAGMPPKRRAKRGISKATRMMGDLESLLTHQFSTQEFVTRSYVNPQITARELSLTIKDAEKLAAMLGKFAVRLRKVQERRINR